MISFTMPFLSGNGVDNSLVAINSGKISGDDVFYKKCHSVFEKGTNRFRGATDKYGLVDAGYSILPSDIIGAFLFAQLENIDSAKLKKRK